MLIAAWDIVTRLAPTDEAEIRHELSGNLCRCTGYVGIVAAVQDVARRHRGAATDGDGVAAAREAAPAGHEAAAAEDTTARGRETDTTADTRARGHESERLRAASAVGGSVPPAAEDDVHGESAAPSGVTPSNPSRSTRSTSRARRRQRPVRRGPPPAR